MNILIIYCHPNPKSFSNSILKTIQEELSGTGHQIRIRDLYDLHFDPVLKAADFEAIKAGKLPNDIKTEQEHLTWADLFIYIYPVWWGTMPALMKGYIDRTHLHGFAFVYNEEQQGGLLGPRKALIFSTHGTSKLEYDANGMTDAMIKTVDDCIFDFCGIEVLDHVFFGDVTLVEQGYWKEYLTEVRRVVQERILLN